MEIEYQKDTFIDIPESILIQISKQLHNQISYLNNDSINNIQNLCNHLEDYILNDIDTFEFKCRTCNNSFNFQLFLLSIPWASSVCLCEIYNDFIISKNIKLNNDLICKVHYDSPEDKPLVLLLTLNEYNLIFRKISMICGLFYDVKYKIINTSTPENLIFYSQILPIVYDVSDGSINKKIIDQYQNLLFNLLDNKLKYLTINKNNELGEHEKTAEQSLKLLKALFQMIKEHAGEEFTNPYSHIKDNIIPILSFLNFKSFERKSIYCAETNEKSFSFEYFEFFNNLINDIRREYGNLSVSLDLILSSITVFSVLSNKQIPTYLSNYIKIESFSDSILFPDNENVNMMMKQTLSNAPVEDIFKTLSKKHTLLSNNDTFLYIISITGYLLLKLMKGEKDKLFINTQFFNSIINLTNRLIGRNSRTHNTKYYYLTRNLRCNDTAPDIKMLIEIDELRKILYDQFLDKIHNTSKQGKIVLSNRSIETLFATLYPYVLFQTCNNSLFDVKKSHRYYTYILTSLVVKKLGINKKTGTVNGKFKEDIDRLSNKFSEIAFFISNLEGDFFPNSCNEWIEIEKGSSKVIVPNFYHHNALSARYFTQYMTHQRLFGEFFELLLDLIGSSIKGKNVNLFEENDNENDKIEDIFKNIFETFI
jgi:hypothetical protein